MVTNLVFFVDDDDVCGKYVHEDTLKLQGIWGGGNVIMMMVMTVIKKFC